MKTYTITKRDIKKGERMRSDGCPVFLAMKRVDKHWRSVDESVDGYSGLYSLTGWECVEVTLPAKVRKWIKDFDAGKEVEPITFTLKSKHHR